MDVNKLIIESLSPLGYPVEFITYTGKDKTYITFNCTDDRGEIFVDNKPIIDTVSMQIHLFIPNKVNYMKLKKQIRTKLINAGFTYPEITILADDDINHLVFECEYSGISETEEE
jgi:hypothetical protein